MLPGVGTLSTRRLTGSNAEELSRHTHGSGYLDTLAQSKTLDLRANYTIRLSTPKDLTLLHGLDIGRSQSNTDAMHLFVDNFILLH